MKNVYEEVHVFYEKEIEQELAISRDWIEGYLRQKAWQGTNDEELRELWRNLKMFLVYLEHTDADYLEEISYQEYSRVIEWLTNHVKGFKATLKPVRKFFSVLLEFYRYLALKKLVTDTTELEQAAEEIAGGDKVRLIDNSSLILKQNSSLLTEEFINIVGEVVEGLMLKLGEFFQRKEFNDDFQRALFLFSGPFNSIPEAEPGEVSMFWQEFWDYFLFDYRLLANDQTPIKEFATTHWNELNSEEQRVVEDLLHTEFAVFTINKVINTDWVECVNMFTEEVFKLPHPEFDYKEMKHMLFFGHVFSRETVLINCITSIKLSSNLRRRIKDEALRQKAIFEIQQPGATWTEFFSRHALAFRHTVDVLLNMAKLNVTPFDQIERSFPIIVNQRQPNEQVMALFAKIMPEYGFSKHDQSLAEKLWNDFSQLSSVAVRKAGAWAAAVIYSFALINSPQGISAEQLANDLAVSTSSIYTNRDKIFKALELAKYDPRYLSTEGLIYSLFTS
ncbi:MAG: hypothetical protein H6Q74_1540 [Firmicutes bacterium]|nr:hypothetical protein [Bacillota bacterium]